MSTTDRRRYGSSTALFVGSQGNLKGIQPLREADALAGFPGSQVYERFRKFCRY